MRTPTIKRIVQRREVVSHPTLFDPEADAYIRGEGVSRNRPPVVTAYLGCACKDGANVMLRTRTTSTPNLLSAITAYTSSQKGGFGANYGRISDVASLLGSLMSLASAGSKAYISSSPCWPGTTIK